MGHQRTEQGRNLLIMTSSPRSSDSHPGSDTGAGSSTAQKLESRLFPGKTPRAPVPVSALRTSGQTQEGLLKVALTRSPRQLYTVRRTSVRGASPRDWPRTAARSTAPHGGRRPAVRATRPGAGYLHEEVGEEAAQRLEGALDRPQLVPGGGQVQAGEQGVHAPRLDSGLLAQPQDLQTGRSPWRRERRCRHCSRPRRAARLRPRAAAGAGEAPRLICVTEAFRDTVTRRTRCSQNPAEQQCGRERPRTNCHSPLVTPAGPKPVTRARRSR